MEIQFYKNAADVNDPEKDPISTQRVNNNGGAVPAGAIYDPGCPLEDQETFVKWTWNGGSGSVQDLLTYVNANYDRLKGKTLVVTAETSHVFYLVYRDEDNRVLKTQAVPSTDATATVQQGYVPNNPKQQLAGWSETKGATEVQYANGASITLTKNTDLYPVCESGFWLLFDSYIKQDDDATTSTFTAPVFYQATENTVKPSNPTRTGYTFEGWFTDKDFTREFTFGDKLTADTTVYAKWTAVETTYTVVFWQQKASDAVDAADNAKTYDYYGSDVRTATTGASASIKDADKQLSSTGLSTEVPAMGFYFTYNDANSDTVSAVVKGDGSTVLNVYYDRKPITFSFNSAYSKVSYDIASSSSNAKYWRTTYTHYGLVDGSFVLLSLSSSNSSYPDSDGDVLSNYAVWKVASTGQAYSGQIYSAVAPNAITPLSEGTDYYRYTYPAGYYLIGTGPNADYRPEAGERTYYFNSSTSNFPSYDNTAKYYPDSSSPKNHNVNNNDNYYSWKGHSGTLVWEYVDSNWYSSTTYYRPLYYRTGEVVAYYHVGEGPDTGAQGQYSVSQSWTGLYGATFENWPELTNGVWGSDNSLYPLPLTQFVPAANSDSALTEQFFTFSNYSGDYQINVIGQDTDGNYTVPIATCTHDGGKWYPTETFLGYTVAYYRLGAEDESVRHEITVDGETPEDTGNLYLYYKRNQHSFIMKSNNTDWKSDTLYYDASLSGYANLVPDNGRPGYYFDGWYADPACSEKFDFNTTMPDNNVTVYAKWTLMRFRVVVDPTGGEDGVSPNNITFIKTQATTFRVNYGEQVEKGGLDSAVRTDPNHPNKTYQLVGWYYVDKDGKEHDFNFAYADWDKIADMSYKDASAEARSGTDPWSDTTYDDADGEHNNVVGKVTIYARWRQRLQSNESLRVLYDAANGKIGDEQTYLDPMFYADHAQAITQPASVSNVPGEQFSVWEVLNQSGEPTGVEVRPGDTFNVLLANAVESTDAQGGKVYTVTLRAKYVSNPTTHVTWVANDGDATKFVNSPDANLNAEISIMPADTFTRDGYEFLGWAKLEEYDATDAPNGVKYDETNGWEQRNLTEADVWLKWDAEHSKWLLQDNTEARAISADNQTPHHVLYAVWKEYEKVTYVADFNAKMKLAEEATITAGATTNSGTFSMDGTTAVYQLGKETTVSDGAQFIFKDVDTAKIHGKFYDATRADHTKAPAKDAAWKAVTVVPASSVYYDDDLKNASAVTVGDGSGYNAQISASPAAVNTEKGTYTFTFYGTGIDVYCTTDNESGFVQGKVDNGDTEATKIQTIKNQSITMRYNVPTLSFRDLGQGEHTLTLYILGSSKYKLDGIRVYNPVDNSTYEGQGTHEQYAAYINMREALVNDHGVSQAFTDDMDDAVLGALFVDDSSKLTTEPRQQYDAQTGLPRVDEEGNPVMGPAYISTFEAYQANSPKHEIYLDSTKQQEILFKLTADGVRAAENGNLWIGLSAPDATANGGTVQYKQGVTQNVTNAVDMYYPITSDMIGDNGVVTIKNTGSSMISVTNLKITGNETIYNAVQAAQPANSEDAAPASLADAMPLVFEPLTMQTVKIAANNGVDPDAPADPGTVDPENPGTPDQPDDPKPGWNDSAYNPMNILKTLFQSLLNGLGNLFKGLGGW